MKIIINHKDEKREEIEAEKIFITDYAISLATNKENPYFWTLRYRLEDISYACIEE